MNCNKCNKWAGAHATLPGQSTEHLCMCPPQRTWVGLMRGVRVEGGTVIISVKGGNDAACELCGELIKEMNSA